MVRGPLTTKDQTRQVYLPVQTFGVKNIPEEMRAMLGCVEVIVSFRAGLAIGHGDYGVGRWVAAMVVSKEVDISIVVEANR